MEGGEPTNNQQPTNRGKVGQEQRDKLDPSLSCWWYVLFVALLTITTKAFLPSYPGKFEFFLPLSRKMQTDYNLYN